MRNDWIAFYRNGEVRVDVVLRYGKDIRYPYGTHAITPHHGEVPQTSIIETRTPPTPTDTEEEKRCE
jgi:hypothetical protein